MTIGTQLRRAQLADRYDAIVIGSGIGGLAVATFLAKAGEKVLVLERHYTAGGFTHTYSRKGYEWDVGLHYIGDVHRPHTAMSRLFDYVTDGQLKWAEMPAVYDRVQLGTEKFDYVKGEEAFITQMIAYFPKEQEAIRSYVKLVKDATRTASKFFSLQTLPAWLAKLLYKPLSREFMSYAQRRTGDVLASLTSDKKLQAVLSAQWGDYGLPPSRSSFAMHALVAKHYLNGACYPVGGSASIARTVADVLSKHGADLVTSAEVQEILCEGSTAVGVKLTNGRKIYARKVISAIGMKNTFLKLLPSEHPVVSTYVERLSTLPASVSHLGLYIGLKADLRELDIPASNLWIYKSEDFDKVLEDWAKPYDGHIPVVYISFPSSKDPDWQEKHPGKSTIELVVPAPYHWFTRWRNKPWQKRGDDYEALKSDMTEKLLAILYREFPQLKDKVHYTELSTPLSTEHFCNYQQGEIYGLDHSPERFQQSWLRSDTPIRKLYITGQDIVSCGVGGALCAGALTALRILGPWRGREIFRIGL